MFSSECTASLISCDPLVRAAANHELVELPNGLLPRERIGGQAGKVLNLVLDHLPIV
jgi:Aminoglycoside-2''-adenylyltransferase